MPEWRQRVPDRQLGGLAKIFYETIPADRRGPRPGPPLLAEQPAPSPRPGARKAPTAETASGDAHVWDVWHGEEPVLWYARNLDYRFVSEFGLQSLPAMETIRSFTAAAGPLLCLPDPRSAQQGRQEEPRQRGQREPETGEVRGGRVQDARTAWRTGSIFRNWRRARR